LEDYVDSKIAKIKEIKAMRIQKEKDAAPVHAEAGETKAGSATE
jgi:hypothetical protein